MSIHHKKEEPKVDYTIVIAKCPKCGKVTPHELFEYYIDDGNVDGEPTVCAKHYRCLNCGYVSEIEFDIKELEEEDNDI